MLTDDEKGVLLEEYEERAAIIEAEGATRKASEARAWKRLLEREGPVVVRELRDWLLYRPLRESSR